MKIHLVSDYGKNTALEMFSRYRNTGFIRIRLFGRLGKFRCRRSIFGRNIIVAVAKNRVAKSEEAAKPGEASLAAVAEKVVECRACERLVAWREDVAEKKRAAYKDEEYWGRPVPGFGDPEARVVLVGLAPGAHGANRTGRMFTGDRSGDWLYRALWQTGFANQPESLGLDDGLKLTGAYITAPVKCAPPANKPTTEERDNCHTFLAKELAALAEAKVFVALGSFAAREVAAFFDLKPRPKFGHGACFQFGEERHLVCSYHPSQQNTFTGKLTEEMLRAVFEQARLLAGY